jgi:hypothetical protein
MRDAEQWEADFLQLKWERNQAEAKLYPQQLYDMLTASSTVMEGSSEQQPEQQHGSDGTPSTGTAPENANGASDNTAAARGSRTTADTAAASLSSFYDDGGAVRASQTEDQQTSGLVVAPRVTPADEVDDRRSLDRAYTQYLALLVRDAATGEWGLPRGERLPGEPMLQAAERCLREAWGGDPSLDIWYMGRAPVGHLLHVHPPEVQAATGQYGAKEFIYRAELIAGRFRLPTHPAAAAAVNYSDFAWLTRDESESVLSRPLFKYLHQIIASGPGEELSRALKWQERNAARGITIAQATGRRAYRVRMQKTSFGTVAGVRHAHASFGFRMPAVATRAQAAIAAQPWPKGDAGASKAAELVAAGDAYYARRADQKARSAAIAKALATPTAATLAQQARVRKGSVVTQPTG